MVYYVSRGVPPGGRAWRGRGPPPCGRRVDTASCSTASGTSPGTDSTGDTVSRINKLKSTPESHNMITTTPA